MHAGLIDYCHHQLILSRVDLQGQQNPGDQARVAPAQPGGWTRSLVVSCWRAQRNRGVSVLLMMPPVTRQVVVVVASGYAGDVLSCMPRGDAAGAYLAVRAAIKELVSGRHRNSDPGWSFPRPRCDR